MTNNWLELDVAWITHNSARVVAAQLTDNNTLIAVNYRRNIAKYDIPSNVWTDSKIQTAQISLNPNVTFNTKKKEITFLS